MHGVYMDVHILVLEIYKPDVENSSIAACTPIFVSWFTYLHDEAWYRVHACVKLEQWVTLHNTYRPALLQRDVVH